MASSYNLHYPLYIISNFLLFSIPFTSSTFSENLIQSVTTARAEKTTKLHFYFQDKLSGKNPTAVKIIGGEGFGFGTTFMIDDALTQELARDSKVVGRAQGTYSLAAQNDLALLMVVTFTFTEGDYNGSSISLLGRNHVYDDVREMPIVGGSGLFRLGRGYALAHTGWFDPDTGDASVEYNVTVMHFEN
ncbi:dirigent protein 23 [Phtheirospermum japonicum]|uniref:Dirigent protein n=1 Tax=Phtheirospermum japonicum TaxID=374723 RepID=A0A830C5S2_9LAMI|nr:dirigent protein 23 [Phtheirospermum japonicum]